MPAELGSLAVVRDAVGALLGREGWSPNERGRVLLAVNEALANAIEHGSLPDTDVTVELQVSAGAAEIRVSDRGRPGVPVPTCRHPAPPPSSTRGRGLVIMRTLADHIELHDRHGGTEARLSFVRASANGAGPDDDDPEDDP